MNLLLPCPVAAATMVTVGGVLEGFNENEGGFLTTAIMALIFYCMYGALPSILYAYLMESLYRKGLSPKSKNAVGIAILYGAALALLVLTLGTILILLGGGKPAAQETVTAALEYLGTGILTGLVVGSLVRLMEKRAPAREQNTAIDK
jgi:ABC-type Co2+ transport system permease subunit